MKNLKLGRLTLGLTVLASTLLAVPQTTDPTSATASGVWERVLQAKGGRDRLHGVLNLLRVQPRPKEPTRPILVELLVFPDKDWVWADQRGSVLGLRLNVRSETGLWMVFGGKRGQPDRFAWFPPDKQAEKNRLVTVHESLLLESRWLQARPLKLSKGRIGKEDFDVVVVDFEADPYQSEYYIDRRTSLVRRITRRGIPTDFEDYKAVDGIMMPSRETLGLKSKVTTISEYAFNVEYDPDIFKRKPSIEDGPDAWKLRK